MFLLHRNLRKARGSCHKPLSLYHTFHSNQLPCNTKMHQIRLIIYRNQKYQKQQQIKIQSYYINWHGYQRGNHENGNITESKADQTDLISALNSLLNSFKISVICKSKRKSWINTEIFFLYIYTYSIHTIGILKSYTGVCTLSS